MSERRVTSNLTLSNYSLNLRSSFERFPEIATRIAAASWLQTTIYGRDQEGKHYLNLGTDRYNTQKQGANDGFLPRLGGDIGPPGVIAAFVKGRLMERERRFRSGGPPRAIGQVITLPAVPIVGVRPTRSYA